MLRPPFTTKRLSLLSSRRLPRKVKEQGSRVLAMYLQVARRALPKRSLRTSVLFGKTLLAVPLRLGLQREQHYCPHRCHGLLRQRSQPQSRAPAGDRTGHSESIARSIRAPRAIAQSGYGICPCTTTDLNHLAFMTTALGPCLVLLPMRRMFSPAALALLLQMQSGGASNRPSHHHGGLQ
eukprot:COSAG06_NODE_103_length_23904_cov_10.413401_18_plen_180_part_00